MAGLDGPARPWGGEGAGEPARPATSRQPPCVLVTTPGSLHVLLTSESGRKAPGGARTVVTDETHAVAGGQRGAHPAPTPERLEA